LTESLLTEFSTPHPRHATLTPSARLVEIAGSASLLVNDGWRLQSVGEDDVWVHGTHIQVVDDGVLQAIGAITQSFQLFYDVAAHLRE
jgi:hypothetical protein